MILIFFKYDDILKIKVIKWERREKRAHFFKLM